MNSLFRGLLVGLAVCVSVGAAVSYVVLNRSTGLYSIPSGAAINSSVGSALDLAVDSGGNFIIATVGSIAMVTPAGVLTTIATAPAGSQWVSVALDGSGNFIVGDNRQHTIWRISPTGSSVVAVAAYPVCAANTAEDVFARVDSLGRYIILHDNCPTLSMYSMTSTGTVTTITVPGTLPTRVGGFTFDATGNYVMTDYNANAIDVITTGFTCYPRICFGPGVNILAQNSTTLAGQILGITRDPSSGNYIVANRGANTLLSVSSDGTSIGTISSGAPLSSPVSVVQIQANLPLSVSRSRLNFGATSDGQFITSGQTVLVTVPAGTGWTATSNPNFITLAPMAATGPQSLSVGIDSTHVPSTLGTSTGTITIASAAAGNPTATIAVTLNVFAPGTAGPPFGNFDSPSSNGFVVSGAIPVTGWALDNIEVIKVDIWREPIQGDVASPNGLVFIGDAVFVDGARPDVEALYPGLPFKYRAGWGYQMLTNFLPQGNGTFRLHAIAHNKAGNLVDLGIKSITVDNAHATKPFGTLDTPAQGGTISGTDSVNFGWALTPQPGMIPTDGSTITVVIDGLLVGHPTYNQFRSDIASLFPGYANSMGAVGFFHINTTTLANGVHTISWNAYDNLGRGEGLGSRYFNVQNTGGSVAAPDDVIDESVATEGVRVRRGLKVDHEPDLIATDADDGYSVTMEEVGCIELHLGAATGSTLVQGEARGLPIGSTLKGGIFYWQLGPGFLGEYTMQFERPDGRRIPVRVSIVPKRYR
jgi:hypothetical protein